MTYSYELDKPIGLVRLQIGDSLNAQGTAFFGDEEIAALLLQAAGDVGKASVQALRNWARRLAAKPKEQIGDYTVDYGAQAKALMTAADTLATELDDQLDDPCVGELSGSVYVRY